MRLLAAIVDLISLVASAWFRKFALPLVVLAVAGGTFYYLYDEYEERQSRARIPVSQLGLEDIALSNKYAGTNIPGYELSGRVKNNSRTYTLIEVGFTITMQDCVGGPQSQACVTIGETSENVYLNIPPGQARNFQESLYFSWDSFHPKGRLVWDYAVSYTKSE